MWPQSLNVSQPPACERCPLPAKLESNPAPHWAVISFVNFTGIGIQDLQKASLYQVLVGMSPVAPGLEVG